MNAATIVGRVMTSYRRAPITEAVFALQVRDALSVRDLERVRDRLKRRFPKVVERHNIDLEIGPTPPRVKTDINGFQLSSVEGNDLIILDRSGITTSRLAPYDAWDQFIDRAKRNFEELLQVIDHPVVVRMATRFINRIDIPSTMIMKEPELARFFNGFIRLPPGLATTGVSFGWNITVIEAETGLQANIAMGQEPSPLLEHLSYTLDIDVYKTAEISLRFDEMWRQSGILRVAKNNIFEKMITPLVRDLLA